MPDLHEQQPKTLKDLEKAMTEHRTYLRYVAFQVVKNIDDTEDVLQDAMLKAFRAFPKFKQQASLKTWLHVIVRNTAFSHYMKRDRRQSLIVSGVGSMTEVGDEDLSFLQHPVGSAVENSPLEILEAEQTYEVFAKALDKLYAEKPAAHLCFTMIALEGRPYEDVAQFVETSVEQVRSRVYAARQYLSTELSNYADTEKYEKYLKPRAERQALLEEAVK